MTVFSKVRKYGKKAKNFVKSTARYALNQKRKWKSAKVYKKGKISSTGVMKALTNLSFKAGATSEYGLMDISHNTTAAADAATRYWYQLTASALEATEYSPTVSGTPGYLLRQISHPQVGTGVGNRLGNRYGLSSIYWTGDVALLKDANQYQTNGAVKFMIVAHYKPQEAFDISNFLEKDLNNEYSIRSRREEDHNKDFRVIAKREIRLGVNNTTRNHFKIYVKPNKIIKMLPAGGAENITYYCVAVCAPDIANQITQVVYNGNVRCRFHA